MPLTDLPLDVLRTYAPDVAEPADFDEFWSATIAQARAAGGDVTLTPAATSITQLVIDDLTFPGFGGEPIRAWISRPVRQTGPLPVIVEFQGYNGGRGVAGEKLFWAASGYVHVFMDTRGQGSGWGTGGDTPDPHGSAAATAGFMTRGISDPEDYYYRRLFTDSVRLIDAVREFDFVDPSRVIVTGGSQGGGISLAVAGLVPDLFAVMPDVPFLCHFRRGAELTTTDPFAEISRYLSVHRHQDETVFRTLSYFDGVNFARRATAPALFSVALMDDIVLPSTVFAAFNRYADEQKEIEVYPFNGHEGGQGLQAIRQAGWLADLMASRARG
jgi:cephalosporin-C deacetylase